MYTLPNNMKKSLEVRSRAKSIPLNVDAKMMRIRVIEVAERAGRAHIGPALSVIDIVHVLYRDIMNRELLCLRDERRDRFILSKGHGCLGLYVVLEKFGLLGNERLEDYCKYDSGLGGHPESKTLDSVEFSTGSLGHGLPVAVGMAYALKLNQSDSKVIVLLGDGESAEGSNWEAALHASKHKLKNLWVIIDFNNMQASGLLEDVLPLEPIEEKWQAFGFETKSINGHSEVEIKDIFKTMTSDKPKCIIANTIKGKGIPIAEDSSEWHHKAKISETEILAIKKSLESK